MRFLHFLAASWMFVSQLVYFIFLAASLMFVSQLVYFQNNNNSWIRFHSLFSTKTKTITKLIIFDARRKQVQTLYNAGRSVNSTQSSELCKVYAAKSSLFIVIDNAVVWPGLRPGKREGAFINWAGIQTNSIWLGRNCLTKTPTIKLFYNNYC